jgi:putative endonuclease
MAKHNELGKKGEQIAKDYLAEKGYTILETNLRVGRNEIDILAYHNNYLVAVEVKTRTSRYFGNPEEFVSNSQIINIKKVLNAYINDNEVDNEIRIDIVSVIILSNKIEIDVFKNIN